MSLTFWWHFKAISLPSKHFFFAEPNWLAREREFAALSPKDCGDVTKIKFTFFVRFSLSSAQKHKQPRSQKENCLMLTQIVWEDFGYDEHKAKIIRWEEREREKSETASSSSKNYYHLYWMRVAPVRADMLVVCGSALGNRNRKTNASPAENYY